MLSQQIFLVVGSGITGLAVIKFLYKHNLKFAITDSRANPPNLALIQEQFPTVAFTYGQLYIPQNTSVIILSPGLALNTPELVTALAHGVEIWSEIELFAEVCTKPVIAITGANGKSTVTTLIADILSAAGYRVGVGGNLGTPALDLLDDATDFYVLELSSFQLETTYNLKTLISIILNVTPDHMDRYATFADYVGAKQRIFINAEYQVYSREDHYTQPSDKMITEDRIYSFGLDAVTNRQQAGVNNGYLQFAESQIMPVSDLPLLGEHNLKNVLAAITVANILQIPVAIQVAAIKRFQSLEHRCELISLPVTSNLWINDSKGTNVGATIAAIVGLTTLIPGKWILILGGIAKDADFSELVPPIVKACKLVILFGQAKEEISQVLHGQIAYKIVTSLSEVVDEAYAQLAVGDGVLFSPACASLDMFIDYTDRGRQFKKLVQAKYQSKKYG